MAKMKTFRTTIIVRGEEQAAQRQNDLMANVAASVFILGIGAGLFFLIGPAAPIVAGLGADCGIIASIKSYYKRKSAERSELRSILSKAAGSTIGEMEAALELPSKNTGAIMASLLVKYLQLVPAKGAALADSNEAVRRENREWAVTFLTEQGAHKLCERPKDATDADWAYFIYTFLSALQY